MESDHSIGCPLIRKFTILFLLFSLQAYAEPWDYAQKGSSGTVPVAQLGTGTADSSKCLKGDGSWGSCGSGSACDAYPIGSVYIAVVSTNPNTLLGCGTWSAIATGRTLVGYNAADTDFDAAEETGGSKTVASAGTNSAPTFTGSALGTHTHTYTDVINHTHTITITDPGHSHTQKEPTGQTGAQAGGTLDASTTGSANIGYSTASATTGITASSANPSGGVATGTTAATSAGTPAGTVSAPTFTGSATSVVQPYIVVFIWKRTA